MDKIIKKIILFILFLLLICCSHKELLIKNKNKKLSIFETAQRRFENLNYLEPLHYLKYTEAISGTEKMSYREALLTFLSFVSDQDSIDELQYYFQNNNFLGININKNNSLDLNSCLEQLDTNRIVTIDYSPHIPAHTFLISSLLPTLKKLGFNYLAIDCLKDSLYDVFDPTCDYGFEISCPEMSNLIRQTKLLDFKIVSFKANSSYDKVVNLFTNTLKQDSLAKVIAIIQNDKNKNSIINTIQKLSKTKIYNINQTRLQQVDDNSISNIVAYSKNYLKSNNYFDEFSCDLYLKNNFKQSDFKLYPNIVKSEKITVAFDSLDLISNTILLYQVYSIFDGNNEMKIPYINRVISNHTQKIDILLPQGAYCFKVKDLYQNIYQKQIIEVVKSKNGVVKCKLEY